MAQLREIKKRIKAVGNIKRITKTMQMIATAKFQASVRRAQATKPYTERLAEVVAELAEAGGDEAGGSLLLNCPPQPAGRELMLVISSNRGLCGAYNANVLRTASQFIRGNRDTHTELEVVGKKGLAFFRFADMPIAASYTHFGDKPKYEDVERLAADYIARFEAGRYDAVRVAYVQFISNARQAPRVMKLLPLDKPEAEREKPRPAGGILPVYDFSPDAATLLGQILPLAVKARLFQAFNEAVVSEQISRMIAMKAATDNAGKMGRSLRRSFNRARQAQITTELSEIIGGAAALG